MLLVKLFFMLAVAACVPALPSPLPIKIGQLYTGKLFHAVFDQTSACTPNLGKEDLNFGLYVGIPQGRLHCNQMVQLVRDDGSKFLATVVEATLPSSNDYHILGSRGVLRQMGVSDNTETIETVKWSLCEKSNNC